MTSHLKKVELHCHLEGAAPPTLTVAQARKYNIDISPYLADGTYVWHDFASFLECYDKVSEVYKTEEDYALLTETYLDELAAIGTIYSELIVSPDHGKRIGLGADAYIEGVCEGMRRAKAKSDIEARLIVTGERAGEMWMDDLGNDMGIMPFAEYSPNNKDLGGTVAQGVPTTFLDWYEGWLDAALAEA